MGVVLGSGHSKRFLRSIVAAGCVFLVLWLSMIFWEMHGLRNLDNAVSTALNSLLNRSETLDLTLVFFSLKPGILLVLGVYLAGVLVFFRRRRPAHPAGVPLYIAYLGFVALACFACVELVDHYVRRPAPGVEIPGFRNPGALLGIRYTLAERAWFPSHEMSIFASIWFAMFFRFGSRVLLLAPFPLILGIADIACGNSWPSDLVASFILGYLVVALLYLLKINEYYLAMEISVGRRSSFLQRSFLMNALEAARRLRKRRRSLNSVLVPEGEELAAGAPGLDIEFDPAPLEEHWGMHGALLAAPPHKGKLFAVRHEGRLYAYKLSRAQPEDFPELLERLELVRSLRENAQLNVCQIVPTLAGDLAVGYGDRFCYVMEFAEGRPVDIGSDVEMCRTVQALARLHLATQTEHPIEEAEARIRAETARFSSLTDPTAPPPGLVSALLPDNAEERDHNFLTRSRAKAEFIARFALYFALEDKSPLRLVIRHNDPHPMNYLVRSDGEIVIVDYDRMQRGLAPLDLVMLLHKFGRRAAWDPDRVAGVLDAYLEVRQMARWETALLFSWMVLPRPLLQALEDSIQRENKRTEPMVPVRPRLGWGVRYGSETREQEAMVSELSPRYGLEILRIILDGKAPDPAAVAAETT